MRWPAAFWMVALLVVAELGVLTACEGRKDTAPASATPELPAQMVLVSRQPGARGTELTVWEDRQRGVVCYEVRSLPGYGDTAIGLACLPVAQP